MFVPLAAVGFGAGDPLRGGRLGRGGRLLWFCGGGGGRGDRRRCRGRQRTVLVATALGHLVVGRRAGLWISGATFPFGALRAGLVLGWTVGDSESRVGRIAVDGSSSPFSIAQFALDNVPRVRERGNLARTVVAASASLPASLASFGVNITGRRFTEPGGCPIVLCTVQ